MSALSGDPPSWLSGIKAKIQSQITALTDASDVRRNALYVFSIRVVSAGLIFLSQIALARWIGVANYGTYVALWSMVLVLGGLSHFGLGVAMMRLVPEYLASNQHDRARGILRGGRLLAFGGGLLTAAVSALAIKLFMPGIAIETWVATALALTCVPMFALTEAQDGIGRGQSWTIAGVMPPYVLRPMLLLMFAGIAYSTGFAPTAVTAIGAAVLATAVTAMAQTMLIGRRIEETIPQGRSSYEFKTWFRISLPLLLYTCAELVLQNADVLILSFLRSPDEVGVYYAAAKTTTLALFVHYAIGSAYAGRFAEANARNDQRELHSLARQSVVWTFWPSVAVTLVVLAAGPYLLDLFGNGFDSAYPAMVILSFGLLVRAATGPSEYVLSMLGYEHDCARSYVIAAVVAIVLNLVLIPWFGALGAASASAAAFATAAILNWRVARRELGINLFVFAPEHRLPLALVGDTPLSAQDLDFVIVRDAQSFADLEDEWTSLYTRAGTDAQVFLSYAWNKRWFETYYARVAHPLGVELAIVVCRRHGQSIMIWPLLKQRIMGMTYVTCIGQPVTQYCDVLVGAGARNQEVLFAAWQIIKSQIAPDVVALRKVRDDAVLAPVLKQIGGETTLATKAPFVSLGRPEKFAEFEQTYSAKTRKNRRRLRRRLDEQGEVAFVHVKSGDEAKRLAQRAVAMKRTWIDARGLISSALHDPRMETFFANAAGSDGTCLVSALTLNGTPISIMISVAGRSRLAGHVFAYDVEHEKSGAGVLLLEECLRYAVQHGYETFDLLAPGDDYKFDWCQDAVGVRDWAVPVSVRGRIYTRLYLSGAREPMKRVATQLPPRWRQTLSLNISRVAER